MSKPLTQPGIDELRLTTRPCLLTDIASAKEGTELDPAFVEDALTYLENYAAPVDGKYLCIGCGSPLAGSLTDQLFGSGGFEWGIAHGEGHCRNCRWPVTMYHRIKTRTGEPLIDMTLPLCVHPDHISVK
jgi:hypothetical protein